MCYYHFLSLFFSLPFIAYSRMLLGNEFKETLLFQIWYLWYFPYNVIWKYNTKLELPIY